MLPRRTFLLGSGLAALSSACAGRAPIAPATPAATNALDDVLARALAAAKRAGATYADARIVRRQWENLNTREDHVVGVDYEESYGVGVRVLAGGAWGFAATARVEGVAAEDAATRAVAAAKANARANDRPVELAPAPVVTDNWRSYAERDPFAVPIEEKAAFLLSLWSDAKSVPGLKYAESWVQSVGEWKIFASSEGSRIEQSITRIAPGFRATAVDATTGEFEAVNDTIPPWQAGWEYVLACPLKASVRRIAEDAVAKLRAPPVTPGKRDLILAPSNLWLTIHESIGHGTELDRALGWEANYAGTSYATPDKLGKLRIGSPLVTIYADKTTPGALATCGYDDDGVKTQRWDLIKDGIFVGYQTTREQAALIGEKASRGTSWAQDFRSFPFQRMPNVSLAPGEKDVTLDDIVAATDDGVYAIGNGSWSIDHQRYNFQFGSQTAYEVKKGKIAGPVRRFAYQANSIQFWNACDMIGGRRTWTLGGSFNDGKGEPPQANAMSHGCPVARFRGVNVLDMKKGAKS
ncbi:MAG: TldD/PmbA family protein [Polyangiaceae bacterium]|jgi:TldD protein